ncbi:hypothetical protein [Streptomyces sp. NPDC057199]
MSTVKAHAATSPSEPLAPPTAERRDPGHRGIAQSAVRLLTRPGAMP